MSVEQLAQVLWDQTANISTAGAASQNFTDPGGGFDSFDSRAADDFNIPVPAGWNIQTLRAIGFYSGGPGPVQSLNVVFFADAAGLPGDVIPGCEYRNIPPTNINDPDFVINLPVACELLPGTYWVSVEANMPFIPNGQWFWFYQTVQTLNLFAWENPLDGFGDGCTAWTPGISCISGAAPDLSFQLLGELFKPLLPVPTLSQWGLIATAGVLGFIGLFVMRRRAQQSTA